MGTLCSRPKSSPDSSGAGDDGHAAPSGGDKQAQTAAAERATAPHKFQEIITSSDKSSTINAAATTAQEDQTDPVILVGKTKKYWVDEKTGYKCFMLFPRGLTITWGEDSRYWRWYHREEASDMEVEIASLEMVWWLEIRGKQELSHLTEGVAYEVAFEVMLKEYASGWLNPVMLGLGLPDGTVRQREEQLQEKPKGQWLDIKVGEVKAHEGLKGFVTFAMFEHSSECKDGLVIKGLKIVPKV